MNTVSGFRKRNGESRQRDQAWDLPSGREQKERVKKGGGGLLDLRKNDPIELSQGSGEAAEEIGKGEGEGWAGEGGQG